MNTHSKNSFKAPVSDDLFDMDTYGQSNGEVFCMPLKIGDKGLLMVRNNGNIGVDHTFTYRSVIKSIAYSRVKHNKVTPNVVKKHFKDVKGCRETYLFYLLECITQYPFKSRSWLSDHLNLARAGVYSGFKELMRLGYISSYKRSRRVTVFNAYVMDDTYCINKQGKRVLRSVYEEVGFM